MAKVFYCNCEVKCHGGKPVSRATFDRHAKYRHTIHTSLSTVLDAADQQDDSESEESDHEPAQKKKKLDGEPGTDADETPDPDEDFFDLQDFAFSDQVQRFTFL